MAGAVPYPVVVANPAAGFAPMSQFESEFLHQESRFSPLKSSEWTALIAGATHEDANTIVRELQDVINQCTTYVNQYINKIMNPPGIFCCILLGLQPGPNRTQLHREMMDQIDAAILKKNMETEILHKYKISLSSGINKLTVTTTYVSGGQSVGHSIIQHQVPRITFTRMHA